MATNSSETDRFSLLLSEIRQQAKEFKKYVGDLLSDLRNQDEETDKGISLLELKCHLMVSYLANLSYVSFRKLSQDTISGDDAIFRLAELRTVLERIRPIEHKLQYQIDKLISAASGTGNTKDALSFKPNPNALMTNEAGSEDDSDADTNEKKTKKYVPPKLMAMPYAEENGPMSKELTRARKRALASSLVRDLQEQYGQGPEEISQVDNVRRRDAESEKEKLRYEEENFIRLQVTKAQKQATRRSSAKSTLESLLDFGDYHMDGDVAPKKRKRPFTKRKAVGKSKGKGKGKGRKK